MQRVKPIYLSRTYGVPLPNPDDPKERWDPEDFLDQLARMKGRLLKHGEPDRNSVAKIILTDWVRGKIPFFVPPPERSEELNIAEVKEAKAKAAKGKAKAKAKEAEAAEVPGVRQNLGSIMQKMTFVPEDVRPLEDVLLEGEDGAEEEVEGENSGEEEDEEEQEEELTWNDVFEGIKDGEPSGENSNGADDDEGSVSEGMFRVFFSLLHLLIYCFQGTFPTM